MGKNEFDNGYILIPKSMLTDDRLIRPNVREFYGVILSLSCQKGYCYASNSYLANYLYCNGRSISRWIATLTELGYIKVEYVKTSNTNHIEQRKIYPLVGTLTDLSIDTDSAVRGILTDLSIDTDSAVRGILTQLSRRIINIII